MALRKQNLQNSKGTEYLGTLRTCEPMFFAEIFKTQVGSTQIIVLKTQPDPADSWKQEPNPRISQKNPTNPALAQRKLIKNILSQYLLFD